MTNRPQSQSWHSLQVYLNVQSKVAELVLITPAVYHLIEMERNSFNILYHNEGLNTDFHSHSSPFCKIGVSSSKTNKQKEASKQPPPRRKKKTWTAQPKKKGKKCTFLIKPQQSFSTDIRSSLPAKLNQPYCTTTTTKLLREKNNLGQAKPSHSAHGENK